MRYKIIGFVLSVLLAVMIAVMITFGVMHITGQETREESKTTEVQGPADQEELQTAEPAKVETVVGPVVKYSIDAQLLPEARKLIGTEILTWLNTSEVPVDQLRFHLYYNAFRSEQTTYLREAEYYKKSKAQLAEMKFGEIRVKEMQIIGAAAGETLTEKIRFISPDDANEDDRTVIEVPLVKPVEPGQSIDLKINFELTMPQIFARTGQEDDYFFIAQWFPKIGVLQRDGLWNCHQFHKNSEFFADFGEYTVNINLPEKFVLGATGNLVKSEKHVDGTITYTFEEKDIHDFAWTAYPDFQKYTEKISLKGSPHETTIVLLLSPEHEDAKERYLSSVKFALEYFAEHIFPYPYKKITVVDPPSKGQNSGGMEYPTLITGGHHSMLPASVKMVELVTVHEFGHQYWYGIVGNDEFREAWLDEGVNSFFELEILDAYFKNSASAVNSSIVKIDTWEIERVRYASLLPGDNVNQYSWLFLNGSQYGNNVYSRAAIFLRSMKNLVGKEKMYDFLKYYAEKYKFKHPTTDDFIETFNAFMNEDFSWAFELYINGDSKLDHAVHSAESVKVESNPDSYRNEVIFLRKEGYFPVELLIKLENQKEIKSFWKDQKKWKKIVFYDTSPIEYAAIDPGFKLPLDYNYLNNSKMCTPDKSFIKRLSLKFGFFFQNVMGSLIF